MKLLAVDTATEACSVALHVDGRVESRHEVVGRSHTERLLPMVGELLAAAGLRPAALDGIVCGIGPGSFAGVRIGVGYVKGLALALDRPVLGVHSLAVLALPALARGAEGVIAAIDARMNEVYVGAYRRGADGLPAAVQAEWVGAPRELAPLAGRWRGVGTGWAAYRDALLQASGAELVEIDGTALPRAADALALALPVWQAGGFASADALTPLYLRNKVALTLEEQAAQRHARPA